MSGWGQRVPDGTLLPARPQPSEFPPWSRSEDRVVHGERTSSWKPSFSTYLLNISYVPISVPVQFSCVQLFASPWTGAHQASLSITNSQNLLRLMSIKSVMPSNRVILCRPLLLLPSIFPSIRDFFPSIFSGDSTVHIRWSKYWSFSLSISPSGEYSGLT